MDILYTNSLCALIAVWLNASQRSRGGVWLNRSAMGWRMKHRALHHIQKLNFYTYYSNSTCHCRMYLFSPVSSILKCDVWSVVFASLTRMTLRSGGRNSSSSRWGGERSRIDEDFNSIQRPPRRGSWTGQWVQQVRNASEECPLIVFDGLTLYFVIYITCSNEMSHMSKQIEL